MHKSFLLALKFTKKPPVVFSAKHDPEDINKTYNKTNTGFHFD